MRSALVLSVAAITGLAAGQSTAQNNYPYTINPDSVSTSDKQAWCDNQRAQCPLICLQQPGVTSMTTISNDCDPKLLTYSCVCENNVAPNITQYSQTLPYYICTAWGTQCVAACNGDNTCQAKCRDDHPCGAQSPYRGNTSLPSTMSSTRAPGATGTGKIPVTGFGGQTAASNAGNNAAAGSLLPGAGLSIAAVFNSLFFGFAILL